MPEPDYDDPAIEEAWCGERRAQVESYLRGEGVDHGEIGDWPAWHVAPYVSIWAVQSQARPGWVGWWVICGDLPTDYLSAAKIRHPRDAVRSFGERWRDLARLMADGDQTSDIQIGRPEDGPSLSPLLSSRASILLEWADDDSQWDHLNEE